MDTTLTDASLSAEVLAKQAISAAVAANWQEAAKLNRKILSVSSGDVEALNRLALAQSCLGKVNLAQKTYKRVLSINPYNIIALKNLDKLSKSTGAKTNGISNGNTNHQPKISSDVTKLFLSEPGKTKIINLLNLAPPQVLAALNCGDPLMINAKNHSVSISTTNRVYLGALPDDLAHRLISFIAGGNLYDAYVKAATPKNLTIFLREVKRSGKFINQPSFTTGQSSSLESD
ncbi:hypothetical protein A3D81_00840 [Candidatus Curtissbacteria bacterium RIFCSPHIGHO2_02_FULL_40_17]|uniref:Uncharacterized protein n=2 Tax=Candidatus Curtissiibacteriota TaxID=1752717 RepID=A0A1F5GK99_9BACT|nr:MAG: hypothetical protein A2693_03980 [Candidatus Curtissbacteria bacterium RIFCSPHIGHO2_01_FULL_40_12]OGD92207.1 MAG: hypothetical protein A3D81_00840 [Candidatus Curtissbacteria bacterium RIFCSPHIGHO2_02_FULL_40_17]